MTYQEEMEELRRKINQLNNEIIEKLAERVDVAVNIGVVKRRHCRPIVDLYREEKVYEQIRRLARERGLDEEGVERIFREIIRLCTEVQREGPP